MKYILILLFVLTTSVVSAQTNQTTTSSKEELLQNTDYAYLLDLAKENITEAREDSHRLNTYRWYISLVPKKWGKLLELWMQNHYSHIKIEKLN